MARAKYYDSSAKVWKYADIADISETLTALSKKADKTTVQALQDALNAVSATVETHSTTLQGLETAKHSHSNKTALDGITAAKISAWDAKASASSVQALQTQLDDIDRVIEALIEQEGG